MKIGTSGETSETLVTFEIYTETTNALRDMLGDRRPTNEQWKELLRHLHQVQNIWLAAKVVKR